MFFFVQQLILKWQFWNRSGVYIYQTNQIAGYFMCMRLWQQMAMRTMLVAILGWNFITLSRQAYLLDRIPKAFSQTLRQGSCDNCRFVLALPIPVCHKVSSCRCTEGRHRHPQRNMVYLYHHQAGGQEEGNQSLAGQSLPSGHSLRISAHPIKYHLHQLPTR